MILPGRQNIGRTLRRLVGEDPSPGSILDGIASFAQTLVPDTLSVDINALLTRTSRKHFSARLLRWVEPYSTIDGEFSLFYMEVDHNLRVGDKVFIEGGAYDSTTLLSQTGYIRGADGYRVLSVDRCAVVLDIPYTGVLPTNEAPVDEFLKVYVVKTQYEFDYMMQTLSMRRDGGIIEPRFLTGQNTVIFLEGTFTMGDFEGMTDFLLEDTTTPVTFTGQGFFIRDNFPGGQLRECTTDILNGVLNTSPTGPLDINSGITGDPFFNNGKLRIMNSWFEIQGVEYVKDRVYTFIPGVGWTVDDSYLPTILTKGHFRKGRFVKGTFNSGLYGNHEQRITYDGTDITWTLGTVLNTTWTAGILGSDHFFTPSNFAVFDRNGNPRISPNSDNNGGAGYNYVFDTDFTGGDVINGNIFNLASFYGTPTTYSATEGYHLDDNASATWSVTLSGGVYYNAEIDSARVDNCTLISSFITNSRLDRVRAVNTEVVASVMYESVFMGDEVVKIQAYEESNLRWFDGVNNIDIPYKLYRFFLTPASFTRLRELQRFYLSGLIQDTPDRPLLGFFDDKLSGGHWFKTDDADGSPSKTIRKTLIQFSTAGENRNSPENTPFSVSNSLMPNDDNPLPSIDIMVENGPDINRTSSDIFFSRLFIGDRLNIEKAFILESDLTSGLFKESVWVSGNCIDVNADHSGIMSSGLLTGSDVDNITEELRFSVLADSFGTSFRPRIIGDQYGENKVVYTGALYYDPTQAGDTQFTVPVRLPDTWTFDSVTPGTNERTITLKELGTAIINQLNPTLVQPYLSSDGAGNRYQKLYPVKFERSIIRGGVIKGMVFQDCRFENSSLTNPDKNLSDRNRLRRLVISDTIMDDMGTRVSGGVFYRSFWRSGLDDWRNGMFLNGTWVGGQRNFLHPVGNTLTPVQTEPAPFKGGVMRISRFEGGLFTGGLFYRNRSNTPGIPGVITDSLDLHHMENLTRHSWVNGEFKGGEFEDSIFETGLMSGGVLFDSFFLTGQATGGEFGKEDLDFNRTRIYTGTFNNVSVKSALFRAEAPDGLYPLSPEGITWLGGTFLNGVFGVRMTGYPVTYITQTLLGGYYLFANWEDGRFVNGEFTDTARWRNGVFENGKFTSYYGYRALSPTQEPLSPYRTSLLPVNQYSWEDGEFKGGEFGNGATGPNSTWYDGIFSNGRFKGRLWRDGVFLNGVFGGHTKRPDFTTEKIQGGGHDLFVLGHKKDYYGSWWSGAVTQTIGEFNVSEQNWTDVDREMSPEEDPGRPEFKDTLWFSGTFDHENGSMDNCVWLNGEHKSGDFIRSTFNPYVNLLPAIFVNGLTANGWYVQSGGVSQNSDGDIVVSSTNTQLRRTYTVEPGLVHTLSVEVKDIPGSFNLTTRFSTKDTPTYPNTGPDISGISQPGLYTIQFTPPNNNVHLELHFVSTAQLAIAPPTLILGTQSGFRVTDDCIWKGGNAISSDFYFSKWENGTFDITRDEQENQSFTQGNMWGTIWEKGIAKYMNAYNTLWLSGIWQNGNWWGSPFKKVLSPNSVTPSVYPGFESDLVNRVGSYLTQSNLPAWESIHLNHVVSPTASQELTQGPLFSSPPTGGILVQPGGGWTANSGWLGNPTEGNWSIDLTTAINSSLQQFTIHIPDITNNENLFTTVGTKYRVRVRYALQTTFLSNITLGPTPFYATNIQFFIGYDPDTNLPFNTELIPGGVGEIRTLSYGGKRITNNRTSLVPTPIGLMLWQFSEQYTVETDYTPSSLSDPLSQIMRITMNSTNFTGNLTFHLLEVSVVETTDEYDVVLNNQLYTPTPWNPGIGEVIPMPQNVGYALTPASPGLYYGNGSFIAGRWENGVWNEGFRKDRTTVFSSDVLTVTGGRRDTVQTDLIEWTYRLRLFTPSPDMPGDPDNFRSGMEVTVGNITGIDINGNRRLIKREHRLVSKSVDNQGFTVFTLSFLTSFPLRDVVRDSDEHLIYISKNLWLDGTFLNGRFVDGVWNNGRFNGFPYVTVMENSHWVTGRFNGGRFIGLTASILDTTNGNVVIYHTGVIQRFDLFRDGNISGEPFSFRYNSWIDVNYEIDSAVNINRVDETYQLSPLGYEALYTQNNYYGWYTKDVLESTSIIRNGHDLDNREYRLGWKFKEFTNHIPLDTNVGQFIDVNDVQYQNTSPPTISLSPIDSAYSNIVTPNFGIDNLTEDGWVFSYGSTAFGFSLTDNRVRTNYQATGPDQQNKLLIEGGRQTQGSPFGNILENFTFDFVENTNTENLERRRYSFVELSATQLQGSGFSTYGGAESNPFVFYNNYPATYSVATRNMLFNGQNVTVPLNQFGITSSVVNRREYFFNKRGLELSIFSGANPGNDGRYEIAIDKVRLVETDMIPFFQFATDCLQQNTFAVWGLSSAPNAANIDWEVAAIPSVLGGPLFDTPGILTEITVPPVGPPTWDNFYINTTASCISYINEVVETPFRAISLPVSTDDLVYVEGQNPTGLPTLIQIW